MMRKISVLLAMLAMGAFAFGCAGEGGNDVQEAADAVGEAAGDAMEKAGDAASDAADAAHDMIDDAADAAHDMADKAGDKMADAAAAMSGDKVTLDGTTGCGHCTFGIGSSCSAAMKTADGTVYLLEGVDGTAVYEERQSEKPIHVVGVTKEVDGVQMVVVETWEM